MFSYDKMLALNVVTGCVMSRSTSVTAMTTVATTVTSLRRVASRNVQRQSLPVATASVSMLPWSVMELTTVETIPMRMWKTKNAVSSELKNYCL